MKEDDICDLLKFERKMLRARISTLQKDKFLQVKLKMETIDSKTQKVNYYYINYKVTYFFFGKLLRSTSYKF
jgi:transcription initiation factor TFIIE subunit alpha